MESLASRARSLMSILGVFVITLAACGQVETAPQEASDVQLPPSSTVEAQQAAPIEGGNRVEEVFARGDFNPHVPLRSWVLETYGQGAAFSENDDTGFAYKVADQEAWIVFVTDEARGEFAAVLEYRFQAFAPKGVAQAPTIALSPLTLGGVTVGLPFNNDTPPPGFSFIGDAQLDGVDAQVFEASPTEPDSMTFKRIFVREGVAVGLSVLVTA